MRWEISSDFSPTTGAGAADYYYEPALPTAGPAAAVDNLLGTWQAQVGHGWGDMPQERFEFQRRTGTLTGSASFLGYRRGIEDSTSRTGICTS